MEIKAKDVAQLRKMTGAGMMDCKNALVEAEGDFERAQEIIREKGKLIAAKRSDRTATEGVVVSHVDGSKAYMLCLACETDFVAKGDEFGAAAKAFLAEAVAMDAADLETVVAAFAEKATALSGKTGEKVEIAHYSKVEGAMCVSYVHMNNKLGTLIALDKEVEMAVAKDVAMQAAAMAPVSISEEDCPKEVIEKEHKIGLEQARLEGKPEKMLEHIATGKVNKFLKENTLVNQALVKDNKKTVAQYLAENGGANVVGYKRFSLND